MQIATPRIGRRFATALALALTITATAAASANAWVSFQAPYGNQYVGPGTEITVTWGENYHPSSRDWIGLYKSGAADTSYEAWVYTTGTTSGQTKLTIPRSTIPGNYELRMFSDNGYTRIGLPAGIGVSPPWNGSVGFGVRFPHNSMIGVATKTHVLLAWRGILAPSSSDWVGLYRVGAPNTSYISYTYTDGSSTGQKYWKLPKLNRRRGYELRLFTNGSYVRIATPARFYTG